MYNPPPGTLINHIPISGPATRRPAGEWEHTVRVSLGFVPGWYARRLGVTFGRRWHEDCLYRYETLTKMKALLHSKFPSAPEFAPRDNGHGCDSDCATLSGVYGSKVVAMLYGLEPVFPEEDWPGDASPEPLSLETLRSLKPMNLDNSPVMERLEAQMDCMEREFGRIDGFLNYQGVLNTAQKLRGSDIFYDMMDDERFVDDLFAHIADTIGRLAARVQMRQRRSGCDIDLLSLSNCVVNMISPAMYERFVLPHDRALSERFARFGIHTCNWNVTPYLDSLRLIKRMGYLDMGAMSDMRRARQMFPEARLAVLYSPVAFQEKPMDQLEADLRQIALQAAPCDIVLADLTEEADDARINHVLALADQIEEEITRDY